MRKWPAMKCQICRILFKKESFGAAPLGSSEADFWKFQCGRKSGELRSSSYDC